MLVACLKVIGQGLVSGTLTTYVFLFSAAGTFTSALTMIAARRIFGRHLSLVGIGVTGALVSNVAQIALAIAIDLLGRGAWVIAPPFIAIGTVSATLLGLVRGAVRAYVPMARVGAGEAVMSSEGPLGRFLSTRVPAVLQFGAGALLMAGFLAQPDLVLRTAEFVALLAIVRLSGRRLRPLSYLVMSAGVIVSNLVVPVGRELVAVLGFPVTESALKSGVAKALTLVGMIAASQFSIRPDLRLPGRFGGCSPGRCCTSSSSWQSGAASTVAT